jgi:hypothetical protein
MRLPVVVAVAAAALSTSANAAVSSATVTTEISAAFTFDQAPSSYGSYRGTDFSSGDGVYSWLGSLDTSTDPVAAGVGVQGWTASIGGPPATMGGAFGYWAPAEATFGEVPMFTFSNPSGVDDPISVSLSYDFNITGSTSGEATVLVGDGVVFRMTCSSCTGLPANQFSGEGSFGSFSPKSGAFSDSGSGQWNFTMILAPASSAQFFFSLGSLVSVSTYVPEPATWSLMLLGASAVGLAARRYRRLAMAAAGSS